jgi:hypothetical protein
LRRKLVFASIAVLLAALCAIFPSRSAATGRTEYNVHHRTSAAWVWYYSAPTQCIVNHEGGVSSVNPYGYYGRFQMDSDFETSDVFGRRAARRWGHASNWPLSVQVKHAHDTFLKRWYNPWPTYWAYHCSSA